MDEYVKDGFIVGVGSGSTVVYAAERLGELVAEHKLNIKCIPTSFQSKQVRSAALVLTFAFDLVIFTHAHTLGYTRTAHCAAQAHAHEPR